MGFIKRNAKRLALESLGWVLVGLGVAALVLPGPGLLMLFAGLALLATQYDWAEQRLDPIRKAALRTAADSVKSWPRIISSTGLSVGLLALGVLWSAQPAAPSWWPLADSVWLFGGWGTGVTLLFSGAIALGMCIYSYITFPNPTNKHKR